MASNVKEASDFPPQGPQHHPGLQHEMTPQPISYDMVGGEGHLEPYKAAGKLKGKKALISGGDSGIGRSVAFLFAKEGVDGITILYHPREQQDAEDTKRDVEKQGARVLLVSLDIGCKDSVKDAVDKHVKEFGKIDILVNNASEQHIVDCIRKLPEDQIERTFKTNVFGMFYLTKYAIPHIPKGSGTIINTTSITTYVGSGILLDYSSTKGAILAFTRSLSQQLVKHGIRVNGVAPGPIWTPLIPASFSPEQLKTFGKDAPMGRAGQPSEAATAYVFLASPDSSYFTGQILHPNGGAVVNG